AKYRESQARTDHGTDHTRLEMGTELSLWSSSQGLVGYWGMDETIWSGAVAHDSGINGYALNFYGSLQWEEGTDGKFYLDFDNDEYATFDWPDFALGPQTISFWMNVDSMTGGWADIVGTTNNGDSNRFHLQTGDSSIMFYNILGGCGSLDSNVVPVVGTWYHVAGTTNGTQAKIYINGELKNQSSCGIASYTSQGIWLGGVTEDFNGKLDDVRLYKRALSANEIADMYQCGR
ncbi:MAG: LamG domain-containing protein, partial [bacterium]